MGEPKWSPDPLLDALNAAQEGLVRLSNAIFESTPTQRRGASNWHWADAAVDRALQDLDQMRTWWTEPPRTRGDDV